MSALPFYSIYFPLALFAALMVFSVSLAFSFPTFRKEWRTVSPWIRKALIILLVLSIILRGFIIPHTSYNIGDELAHFNSAISISETGKLFICHSHNEYGRCIDKKEDINPPAHAVFISIFLLLFGKEYSTVFMLMAIISSISIVLLFFFAKALFRSDKIGILSSFFLAFSPISLMLSGTGTIRNTGQFFALAMLVGMAFLIKKDTSSHQALFFSSLFITIHVMPEYILLLIIAGGYIFFRKRALYQDTSFIASSVLLILVTLPYLFKLKRDMGFDASWGEIGTSSSLEYLSVHFFPNLAFFFNGESYLLIVSIGSVLSIMYIRNNWKSYLLPFLIVLIYLLFYSGYALGLLRDSFRYNLILIPFLSCMAAFAIVQAYLSIDRKPRRWFVFFIILLISFSLHLALPFFSALGQEVAYQQSEFEYLNALVLPEEMMVIARNPLFIRSTTGRNAISPRNILKNESIMKYVYDSPGHFLFYREPLCKICSTEDRSWDTNCPRFEICYRFFQELNSTLVLQRFDALDDRYVFYSLHKR